MSESTKINCLRCNIELEFVATKMLDMRALAFKEILSMPPSVDLFKCPKCGHFEFFDPETGRELRQHSAANKEKEVEGYDYRGF